MEISPKDTQKETELVPLCVHFMDGTTINDLSEDERDKFMEAFQEVLDYAKKVFADDSYWKKD
ncbi:hypothetical protein [Lactococcus garvieae]|uniref:hypothetical protein n=1 Tax=Lactococcus garvieae TaxID=1363 RepID=UPI00030B3D8F|nr:hypothetical protein [Lactococcus garvieae]